MKDSFINKYKPHSIDDLIIDSSIKKILNNIVERKLINILFVGGNETGKTSIINILNNIINENVLINNIKEKGINNFRTDIKIYCQLTITNKTILIDDIETINDSCQYVIKSLIDTYKGVLFVATTNNIKKIIDPLKSRFMVINLDNVTNLLLKKILLKLNKKEDFTMDSATVDYIVKISNFSINKMYNYLEKIKLIGKKSVTISECNKILTNNNYKQFDEIIFSCKKMDINKVISLYTTQYKMGYSIVDIFENFYNYVKFTTKIKDELKFEIIKLLCEYISIIESSNESKIEIYLFSYELVNLFKI